MSYYEKVAALPIEVSGYSLEGLSVKFGDFERLTTIIHVEGGGDEGIGEDVTYDALDHVALQDAGPTHDLTAATTIGEFCELMGTLDTFGYEPAMDVSRLYRRWAFESAALDLALRQAGTNLADYLGKKAEPLNFVVSMRLAPMDGESKSSIEPFNKKLAAYPGTRFKLDPTNDWTDEIITALAESGAVDSLDLKGFYRGTPVDVTTDPVLYQTLVDTFPDAWLEDPDLTPETDPILEPHRDRVTWDAPIHSIADIEALPFPPKMVNIKPSRVGGLESLFAAYEYCEEHGIGAYGGGQSELGQGRGHIQYLASIFHPDTPNDTAPSGYNDPSLPAGLPSSPLEPAIEPIGFRWRI